MYPIRCGFRERTLVRPSNRDSYLNIFFTDTYQTPYILQIVRGEFEQPFTQVDLALADYFGQCVGKEIGLVDR